MDFGNSIFRMVDLISFCRSESILTLTLKCLYHSLLIALISPYVIANNVSTVYSRSSIIRINWDGDPSGNMENPDMDFSLQMATLAVRSSAVNSL